MNNQKLEKTNKSLFIMTFMFFLGLNFESMFKDIIKFFSINFTRFSLEQILYIIWFELVCVSLLCSVLGIYLFLNKGKVKNLYLYIFLVLNTIQLNIFGTQLSWSYGGITQLGSNTGWGIKIGGIGFLLFIWYLIIVKRTKINEPSMV